MEFQHDISWDNLKTVFDSKLTLKNAWNRFLDLHELLVPKPYWTALRQLDIVEEQTEIVKWLQQLILENPIPDNVVAFWIGILKFSDKEKEIPTIYLIGAETFEKDDIEWACDPTYMPENRYVQPEVLKQIDDIARTDKVNYAFLDWILPHAYCIFTIDEIIREKLNKKLFLKTQDILYITVGHDNGDYMNLSNIE